ncbi:MAG: hypothetical protein LC768_13160 [Acidobacteria bacterium]|nr:hypothetical protein [Acidobacteriota bacterium]MCA1639260.1 hypothetical protein [Acidobacteriota bacterium]
MAKDEKDEKVKLIPFTRRLEEAIEVDARRCRRSFVRQVEAVLMTYYGIDDVEVDRQQLEFIGELAPHSKQKIPVIKAIIEPEKKKRRA